MANPESAGPISSATTVRYATVRDTLAVLRDVIVPTLAKGPLIRRRNIVRHAERRGLDDKAVRRMQKLRRKYGAGPLVLKVPFRRQALVLSAADANLILESAPEPFAAATREKRAALDHFQPDGVLGSHGGARTKRRDLNEETLETGCSHHSMAGSFARVAAEEMDLVATKANEAGLLDWDTFFIGWYKMVRRIVLGDPARDDEGLTDRLKDLRQKANFAFMQPKSPRKRGELLAQLQSYIDDAPPGSLAGRMAASCSDPDQKPHHQLPQYLFAFDPAGMASFRTLALLSSHPSVYDEVMTEIVASRDDPTSRLRLLHGCFLEALRLWPTTPAILRETTRDVIWGDGRVPAKTHLFIYAPFLHRDDEQLAQAHSFDPSLWIDKVERPDLGMLPFSHGPVICPAKDLVPLVASFALRRLLDRCTLELSDSAGMGSGRLPGTLDNYTLAFRASPRKAAAPPVALA
jgi:hypothetical protein